MRIYQVMLQLRADCWETWFEWMLDEMPWEDCGEGVSGHVAFLE